MFPYIGGKSHHVNWMDKLFPNDFSTFVEVFGGAGWVSVKSDKITKAKNIIYNDYNPLIANVFECFRCNHKLLWERMNDTPKSEVSLFRSYQKELFVDLDWSTIRLGDVELAVKYLYLQTQIFAGTPLSSKNVYYFTEQKANGKYPSKYDTLKNKLLKNKITDRLEKIDIVEKIDCIELIKKYDSPNTFFYLDPPYYKFEFYYSKDFPKEKHIQLSNLLRSIKGKFALSYYDFDDLRVMYPESKFRWHRQGVYRSAATRSSKDENYSKNSKGVEILIMNYS